MVLTSKSLAPALLSKHAWQRIRKNMVTVWIGFAHIPLLAVPLVCVLVVLLYGLPNFGRGTARSPRWPAARLKHQNLDAEPVSGVVWLSSLCILWWWCQVKTICNCGACKSWDEKLHMAFATLLLAGMQDGSGMAIQAADNFQGSSVITKHAGQAFGAIATANVAMRNGLLRPRSSRSPRLRFGCKKAAIPRTEWCSVNQFPDGLRWICPHCLSLSIPCFLRLTCAGLLPWFHGWHETVP